MDSWSWIPCCGCAALHTLYLSHCVALTPNGAAFVAQMGRLRTLEACACSNLLSDATLEPVLRALGPNLVSLDVSECGAITSQSLNIMASVCMRMEW